MAAAPTAQASGGSNGGNGGSANATTQNTQTSTALPAKATVGSTGSNASAQTNGHKAVDFVSEDDVRRALQKGEKIYVDARTIITPAARDMGDAAEVFAKG